MTDANNMIVPTSLPSGNTGGVPLVTGGAGRSDRAADSVHNDAARSEGSENESTSAEFPQDSLAGAAVDLDEFAKVWIRRVRLIISRSSQLVERESLLLAAIKRLDDQKAEWRTRTAAKESSLRDQSERLAEAWLEVESERRRLIQQNHVKAATGGIKPQGVAAPKPTATSAESADPRPANAPGGSAAPAAAMPAAAPAAAMPAAAAAPAVPAPAPSVQPSKSQPGPSQPTTQPTVHPPAPASPGAPVLADPAHQPGPVPQSRIGQTAFTHPAGSLSGQMMQPTALSGAAGPNPQNGQGLSGLDALKRAEAATREKIAEFKRMQRAIRSSRNK